VGKEVEPADPRGGGRVGQGDALEGGRRQGGEGVLGELLELAHAHGAGAAPVEVAIGLVAQLACPLLPSVSRPSSPPCCWLLLATHPTDLCGGGGGMGGGYCAGGGRTFDGRRASISAIGELVVVVVGYSNYYYLFLEGERRSSTGWPQAEQRWCGAAPSDGHLKPSGPATGGSHQPSFAHAPTPG
jgi:hypothetical protein